jgi:hypothetical protein
MIPSNPAQLQKLKTLGWGSAPFYAKYKGICGLSGLPIVPGDLIVYMSKSLSDKKVVHVAALNLHTWFPSCSTLVKVELISAIAETHKQD